VLAKADAALVPDLLVPGQPIAMGVDTSNYVIHTVAIDVINQHLRRSISKMVSVLCPNRVAGERLRLLPPTVLFEDVGAPVAIDIPGPNSVRESLIFALGTDGMKCPWRSRVLPVGLRITNKAAGT